MVIIQVHDIHDIKKHQSLQTDEGGGGPGAVGNVPR